MTPSFHPIDWFIIAAYLLTMAAVGVYFATRQTSLDRYLLADRSMGWLPVGMSLMAALNIRSGFIDRSIALLSSSSPAST